MIKFSKKNPKNPILGGKFGQRRVFFEKKGLLVFKYSNYIPSCKKKTEKNNDRFLRKMPN